MTKKKKDAPKWTEASPSKSLSQELTGLQRALRVTAQAYEKRLKAELTRVTAWNEGISGLAKPSREQVRDLGDMLGLLRKLKLKPEKGRRRDLRKIDSVLEDLVSIIGQKRLAKAETGRGTGDKAGPA